MQEKNKQVLSQKLEMQRMAIVYKGHSYSNFEVNVVVLFCLTVVTKCKYILLEDKLCICAFTNH